MLALTAYTSLLFAVPAALLRCGVASSLFAALTPVSFAVHALGGKGWAVAATPAGRALVLLDKALAQLACAATSWRVLCGHAGWAFKLPFVGLLATIVIMYYALYPAPPRCWVAHHAALHAVALSGALLAYVSGA